MGFYKSSCVKNIFQWYNKPRFITMNPDLKLVKTRNFSGYMQFFAAKGVIYQCQYISVDNASIRW